MRSCTLRKTCSWRTSCPVMRTETYLHFISASCGAFRTQPHNQHANFNSTKLVTNASGIKSACLLEPCNEPEFLTICSSKPLHKSHLRSRYAPSHQTLLPISHFYDKALDIPIYSKELPAFYVQGLLATSCGA